MTPKQTLSVLTAFAVVAAVGACAPQSNVESAYAVPAAERQTNSGVTPFASGLTAVNDADVIVYPYNMSAQRLRGMEVRSSGGKRIGQIASILVDPSNDVNYLTVSTGETMALGAREHIVPLSALHLQGNHFVTQLSEGQIENRPLYGTPQR